MGPVPEKRTNVFRWKSPVERKEPEPSPRQLQELMRAYIRHRPAAHFSRRELPQSCRTTEDAAIRVRKTAFTYLKRKASATRATTRKLFFRKHIISTLSIVEQACCFAPQQEARHLDRRRRTLPPQWRDPCIKPLLLPLLVSYQPGVSGRYA
jgi:hypothetical protein